MYSDRPFGHKQIFSTSEMAYLLRRWGFENITIEKFHELSFPYDHYLKKIFRHDRLVRMSMPFVFLFFKVVRIRNKMLVTGRKGEILVNR